MPYHFSDKWNDNACLKLVLESDIIIMKFGAQVTCIIIIMINLWDC